MFGKQRREVGHQIPDDREVGQGFYRYRVFFQFLNRRMAGEHGQVVDEHAAGAADAHAAGAAEGEGVIHILLGR